MAFWLQTQQPTLTWGELPINCLLGPAQHMRQIGALRQHESYTSKYSYQTCRCSLALNTEKSSQPSTCTNSDQNHASKVGNYLQQLRMQRAMVLHCPQDQHLARLTTNTKRSPKGQMLRRRGLARLRNQLLFRYSNVISCKLLMSTCFTCWCCQKLSSNILHS